MKYVNLKLTLDSESLGVYIDAGNGEHIHVVYWNLDEWIEDAESSVPASLNAVHLFYTDQDELIKRISGAGCPDFHEYLFTKKDLKNFLKNWGQTHGEICSELGYDEEDATEELMADGYFWYEPKELWCNEQASMFTTNEQVIADYLNPKYQD